MLIEIETEAKVNLVKVKFNHVAQALRHDDIICNMHYAASSILRKIPGPNGITYHGGVRLSRRGARLSRRGVF